MTRNPRLIGIANEKGGVGKTAMVVNLGGALCKLGKKVLLVDVDPQFNTTKSVGIRVTDEMPTIYDLLMKPEKETVKNAVVNTKWAGLDLIPSHIDLSGAEVELSDTEGRENRLRIAMGLLNDAYDFILVDTPPSLSLLTVNVFAYVHDILVPCQTHPYAYDALEDLFDTISVIQDDINPDLKIMGVIPTFFDSRTRVSHTVLAKLRQNKLYKPFLFDTVIRTNTTVAESAAAAKPVVFYRTTSFGALDYMALANELIRKKPV